MKKNKVFLVTYGIAPESGGVTVATFNQSKMFTDAGYDVSITSFDFQPQYEEIFNELKGMNRVYNDVHHINKYEYYAELNTLSNHINTDLYDSELPVETAEYLYTVDKDDANVIHYFKDGALTKTKYYNEDKDKLIAIEYIDAIRNIEYRIDFSPRKYVLRKQFYSSATKNVARESFYTSDGYCYMTRYHDEEGNPGQVFLFDRNSNEVIHFNGNRAHDKHWLNEIAVKYRIGKNLPLFITNGQGSGLKVMAVDKKKAVRAYFVHNNHFEAPYTYGSKVKAKYNDVFSKIKKLDALIVLTEKQKEDIQRQYGDHNNIYVIPNAITIAEHEPVQKNENEVIMVTRLEPQKNLQRAVEMFHLVTNEIPDAKINIFGKGRELSKLEDSIKKHNMENHIFLRGYSKDIKQEIKKATLSLLTSNYEGLPLAAVESLQHGTPVVTYDFNYGATDIVDNETSGFVVELENKEKLAEKIIYLLRNKDIALKMGEEGRKQVVSKYSNEVVLGKWVDMLESLSRKA
ncbi:Glycosyl transferases group 1 [Terribacillus saccharophilus]|uniref:Glycosyl transferases group 1 n=2 Tax=Terribacillus saccharophilus TaxID=361277 RepID=A0AAX2EFQ3_9BACI|nr:Glycosyl transferases group 1 [Terribacillus saccharophilus]